MKTIALLLIQCISCLLAGWRVSETIFIVLASAMWLLVFKYVFIKVIFILFWPESVVLLIPLPV